MLSRRLSEDPPVPGAAKRKRSEDRGLVGEKYQISRKAELSSQDIRDSVVHYQLSSLVAPER